MASPTYHTATQRALAQNTSKEQMDWAMEKYPAVKKMYETGVIARDGREANLLKHIYTHPDLPNLRNNPTAILSVIDHYSGQEEFLMNLGDEKSQVITNLIRSKKPKTYLEFGGYVGYSAIHAGYLMKQVALSDGVSEENLRVWSLELDAPCAAVAKCLIELAGLDHFVKVIIGPGDETVKRLKGEGKFESVEKIDLALIDHVSSLYVSAFQTLMQEDLLKEGSVVVADNVVTIGAPEYREYVRKLENAETEGVKALIQPGGVYDEMDITTIKS